MRAWLLAAGLLAAIAAAARAQTTFETLCAQDAARVCPTLTGGGLLGCLLHQEKEVSAACWRYIGPLAPCSSDIERRCYWAVPGNGHIEHCLQSQAQDLSRGCLETLRRLSRD